MQSSEVTAKVYKMDEAARAKNREAQRRWRNRQKIKQADATAIGNEIAHTEAQSSLVEPPGAA